MGNLQESHRIPINIYHLPRIPRNQAARPAPQPCAQVVLNSATKNAADPSKLHFRILTTEDEASELLQKVKDRCGVADSIFSAGCP